MNSMKRQNDRILKEELPRSVSAQYATGGQWRNNSRKNEGFALETNRDHSVIFGTASKYCILDSSVDHDGYSISSEGFLPTVVDIMVI